MERRRAGRDRLGREARGRTPGSEGERRPRVEGDAEREARSLELDWSAELRGGRRVDAQRLQEAESAVVLAVILAVVRVDVVAALGALDVLQGVQAPADLSRERQADQEEEYEES